MSNVKCTACGTRYDDEDEGRDDVVMHNAKGKRLQREARLCGSCYDAAEECETCDYLYLEGHFHCECGSREVGKFVLRSYHSDLSPRFKGDSRVRFGLEMEVEGDFRRQAMARTAAGFGESDVYAEEDCSVDVEWVTRPLLPAEAPAFIRRAVTALKKGGAVVAKESCGCHHNVDRHALSDEGWGKVCIAVDTFYPELFKFSGSNRESHYACRSVLPPSVRPAIALMMHGSEGHSCVNTRKSGLVEIRLPAMHMDAETMVSQFKLYHNLVVNAGNPGMDPRNFISSFGPLDDGMKSVLKKIGFDYSTDPPVPQVVVEAPVRQGFWDIRVGDAVKLLDSAGVYKKHGIPPEMQSNLLEDRSPNSNKRNSSGEYMVTGEQSTRTPLHAQRRFVLHGQGWYYAGQLVVVKSGDSSQLWEKVSGQTAGPMAFNPPVPHEAYKATPVVAVVGAQASQAATPEVQPRTRRRRACA